MLFELGCFNTFLLLFVAYVIVCYIVTHFFLRTKLNLVYDRQAQKSQQSSQGLTMDKIVDASNLQTGFEYVPYVFAWLVHWQGLIFSPYSMLHETIFQVKYFREIFQM